MTKLPRLTLIAGPTASGKSRLALDMARETNGVIINADSQQLYADLRILTARPSLEDEAVADHRLYGIADASEVWSVGKWSRTALDQICQVQAEGRHAILVGGTGLYFNALTKGLADIPEVPPFIRDMVEEEYEIGGEEEFRNTLREVDPEAEARIYPSDRQRLIRALSVFRTTGQSLSHFQAETRPLLRPDSWKGVILEPERDHLYDNCDARVLQMMDMGALEEVRALMARDLDPSLPAMKAVGAPELISHLSGKSSRSFAIKAVQQATRHYAKRQLTWFRNQCKDWPRA